VLSSLSPQSIVIVVVVIFRNSALYVPSLDLLIGPGPRLHMQNMVGSQFPRFPSLWFIIPFSFLLASAANAKDEPAGVS
jgi:hypothetical protein